MCYGEHHHFNKTLQGHTFNREWIDFDPATQHNNAVCHGSGLYTWFSCLLCWSPKSTGVSILYNEARCCKTDNKMRDGTLSEKKINKMEYFKQFTCHTKILLVWWFDSGFCIGKPTSLRIFPHFEGQKIKKSHMSGISFILKTERNVIEGVGVRIMQPLQVSVCLLGCNQSRPRPSHLTAEKC